MLYPILHVGGHLVVKCQGMFISVGLSIGSSTFEYLLSAVLSCIEKNGKFKFLVSCPGLYDFSEGTLVK